MVTECHPTAILASPSVCCCPPGRPALLLLSPPPRFPSLWVRGRASLPCLCRDKWQMRPRSQRQGAAQGSRLPDAQHRQDARYRCPSMAGLGASRGSGRVPCAPSYRMCTVTDVCLPFCFGFHHIPVLHLHHLPSPPPTARSEVLMCAGDPGVLPSRSPDAQHPFTLNWSDQPHRPLHFRREQKGLVTPLPPRSVA